MEINGSLDSIRPFLSIGSPDSFEKLLKSPIVDQPPRADEVEYEQMAELVASLEPTPPRPGPKPQKRVRFQIPDEPNAGPPSPKPDRSPPHHEPPLYDNQANMAAQGHQFTQPMQRLIPPNYDSGPYWQTAQIQQIPPPTVSCNKCGSQNCPAFTTNPPDFNKCYAAGKMCNFCANIGHFISVCKKKQYQTRARVSNWNRTNSYPTRPISRPPHQYLTPTRHTRPVFNGFGPTFSKSRQPWQTRNYPQGRNTSNSNSSHAQYNSNNRRRYSM